jgi:hypothetical protein
MYDRPVTHFTHGGSSNTKIPSDGSLCERYDNIIAMLNFCFIMEAVVSIITVTLLMLREHFVV